MSKGLSSLLQFGLRWLNLKDLLPLSQNTKIPLDVPRSLPLKEELAPSLGWGWGRGVRSLILCFLPAARRLLGSETPASPNPGLPWDGCSGLGRQWHDCPVIQLGRSLDPRPTSRPEPLLVPPDAGNPRPPGHSPEMVCLGGGRNS